MEAWLVGAALVSRGDEWVEEVEWVEVEVGVGDVLVEALVGVLVGWWWVELVE